MQWQLDNIAALQAWSAFDGFMRAISWLGNEEFYLLLIPIFYLGINREAGLRLGLLVLLGDSLNHLFKVALGLPRPYWLDTRLRVLAPETSYGFPSSHAQNASSVWIFLAGLRPRWWIWLAASTLVALISFARVYLGAHFWTDILGGIVIGLLFLWLFLKYEPPLRARFENAPLRAQLLATTALVAGLILLGVIVYSATANWAAARGVSYAAFAEQARNLESLVGRAGALWGLGIGYAMERRWARFEISGAVGRRVVMTVLGVLGVLVLWRGLALVFPREPETIGLIFRFVRYAVMTWWVVFLAPYLFLRVGRPIKV